MSKPSSYILLKELLWVELRGRCPFPKSLKKKRTERVKRLNEWGNRKKRRKLKEKNVTDFPNFGNFIARE